VSDLKIFHDHQEGSIILDNSKNDAATPNYTLKVSFFSEPLHVIFKKINKRRFIN